MDATQSRLSAARKYLAVFEESWQASHADAMRLRDFEEGLAHAVKVFELVDGLIQQHREDVFRGVAEPNPEVDIAEKDGYSLWLKLIDEDLPKLEELERTYHVVEGADQLRTCRARAIQFLQNWQPAKPALAVGSRVIDFDEEDADQIRGLLNAPTGAVGRPARPARSLANSDPSAQR